MGCKCQSGKKKLCPLSFGLGLGVTLALAVIIWTFWTINYGPTEMMTTLKIPVPSMHDGLMHALWALIKGFILGFFIALFYDLFSCCCPCCKKCKCNCNSNDKCNCSGKCNCNCDCCKQTKTEAGNMR